MWVRIHLILYIEAAPRNPGPIKLPGVEVGPHGIFGRLLRDPAIVDVMDG